MHQLNPWEGLIALDAMIQVFNSVNALKQRPTMKVNGIILEGGIYMEVITVQH